MVRIALQDPTFSLAQTCAPVAWARGRWPNVDWRNQSLIWVGWDEASGSTHTSYRVVKQIDQVLTVEGARPVNRDEAWVTATLALNDTRPDFNHDEVLEMLALRFSGLRPFSFSSIVEGLFGSIVGQSISVAAAATTQRRIAECFAQPLVVGDRQYWPTPTASHLANATPQQLREAGVTWRRAEALVAVGQAALSGGLPTTNAIYSDPEAACLMLESLPGVGPWTARSALLWGLGLADAHPTKDAALLRAARLFFQQPDLTFKGLDSLAETWRPWRGWAARLLWTGLLGPAPTGETRHDL